MDAEDHVRHVIEQRPYTTALVALCVGWFLGRDSRPAILGLPRFLRDLAQGRIPARGDLGALARDLVTLGHDGAPPALRRLAALHHAQHDLLKIGLAPRQRRDF